MQTHTKIWLARYRDDFQGKAIDETVQVRSSAKGLIATTLFSEPEQIFFPSMEKLSELSEQEMSKAQTRLEQQKASHEQNLSSTEQAVSSNKQSVNRHMQLFTTLANNARGYLPQKQGLLCELEQRWKIIELLSRPETYENTRFTDFNELVNLMESDRIRYCPKPIYDNIRTELVNSGLQLMNRKKKDGKLPDRRRMVTTTIQQFIEYRRQYYPSKFWLKVNKGLDAVDSLLTYIIKIV